jgi:HAMP domain-containing protein
MIDQQLAVTITALLAGIVVVAFCAVIAFWLERP